MLSAEGQVHKRQRRVALPAFSGQNLRSLVEISFKKGIQLRDAWIDMLPPETEKISTARIDICQFLSRATFDVVGLAGDSGQVGGFCDSTDARAQDSITASTQFKTKPMSSLSRTEICLKSPSPRAPHFAPSFPYICHMSISFS